MPPTARRNFAGAALLALLLPLALARAAHAAPTGPAPLRPLDERTLGFGESHNYFFPMKAGEYLRIDVEQNDDIDAGIRLYDSQGKLLFHGNSYTGSHGAETMSWIASASEVLRVEVYIWQEDRLGRYAAAVDGPRAPHPYDIARTAAVVGHFVGVRREEVGLFWAAEHDHRESLALWESLSEPRWTAVVKRHVADALYRQGETEEGAAIFKEVWPDLVQFEESSLLVQAGLYIARSLQNQPSQAEPYFSAAVENLPVLSLDLAADSALHLALAAEKMGFLESATALLRYESDLRRALGDTSKYTESLGSLSRLLRRLGRVGEARQAAERQARFARTPEEWVRSRIALGLASIASQDSHEAIEIMRPALAVSMPESTRADLLYALGWAEFEEGALSTAEEHFLSAAAVHTYGRKACDLAFLSMIATKTGDLHKSRLFLSKAREADSAVNSDVAAFLSRATAELAAAAGNTEEALRSLDTIFRELSSQRDGTNQEAFRATYWATKGTYVESAIDLLLQLFARHNDKKYLEIAFTYLERSRAPSLVERLSSPPSTPESPTTQERILERALNQIDDTVADLRRRRPAGWRYRESFLSQQREELILSSRLGDPIRRQHLRSFRSSPRLTLEDLRSQLAADEQYISYFIGTKHSYGFLFGQVGIELALLPPRRPLESEILAHAEVLREVSGTRNIEASRQASQQLSELIVAPFASTLTAKRLLFSLDGALHRVPLGAISDPRRKDRLLLETTEIAVIPSLTSLSLGRSGASLCHGTAVIIADDPMLLGTRDLEAVRRFTASAVTLKANRFQLLSGTLDPFCYLHFATHGISNQSWPDTATLLLQQNPDRPRERIYAFEIQRMSLSAELVVLAACESGVGDIRGEGIYGLPRAFIAAGVRRVVATLWPVDSGITTQLMNGFYNHLKDGQSASGALRSAQLDLLARARPSDPPYWAAFQLIGDPAL